MLSLHVRPPSGPLVALVLVLLVAAGARAIPVLHSAKTFRPVGDAAEYDRHAVSIARDGRYPSRGAPGRPTAFRPPAYPHVLAGVYLISGTDDARGRWLAGRLLGILMGVGVVAALGWLAVRLFDRTVALVAMALAAVYPPLIAASDALLAEGLFTLLVLAATACALEARGGERVLRWVAACGVLAGLSALTRTNGLALVLPLGLGVAAAPHVQGAVRARNVAVLLVATAIVLTPWTIRNWSVFDRFVLTSTQTGFTLAGTYNDVSRNDPVMPGAWRAVVTEPYADVLARSDLNEAAQDARLTRLAAEYIWAHPSYPLSVAWHGTGRLLNLNGLDLERRAAVETGIGPRFSDLSVYAFWLLGAMALVGAASRRAWQVPVFTWVVPALLATSLVFVIARARYRVPIDPFVVLLAALGLLRLRTGLHRARVR